MHCFINFFIFFTFFIHTQCHWHSGYFRWASDGFANYANWMDKIEDNVNIFKLALPATHDSGTGYVSNRTSQTRVDIVVTQCLKFNEQLIYGIRVFDIRLRHFKNRFRLHHNDVYLNVTFDDFLDAINNFLDLYGSETVLFRLKEEWAPFNCTRSLGETLTEYLKNETRLFVPNDFNVTLATVRNKFIILSDNLEFHKFGLKYIECNIQDDYYLTNNWRLYNKWTLIKQHLIASTSSDNEKCFINFLSGSGGAFPFFVASGHSSRDTSASRLFTGLLSIRNGSIYPDFPRCICSLILCAVCFEGTNILAENYLQQHSNELVRPPGIIMIDFPGTGLISQIIETNWKQQRKSMEKSLD